MLTDTIQTRTTGDDLPSAPASFPAMENIAEVDTKNERRSTTLQEVEAACAECQAFGDSEGFFGTRWDKRVEELLVPSYRLLSGIGDDHALLAFVIAKCGLKTTKATRNNSALVSVQITARPHDTHHRKLCSSWALILNEARAANVSVEGFAEWVKGRDKTNSSASPAVKRAEAGIGAQQGQPELGHETLTLLASLHTEVMEAMTMPGSQVERLRRLAKMFQKLADELAADEASSSASKSDTNAANGEVADA